MSLFAISLILIIRYNFESSTQYELLKASSDFQNQWESETARAATLETQSGNKNPTVNSMLTGALPSQVITETTKNKKMEPVPSNSMSSKQRLEYLKHQCRTTFETEKKSACASNRHIRSYFGQILPENSTYSVLEIFEMNLKVTLTHNDRFPCESVNRIRLYSMYVHSRKNETF